jgi:putative nucleotidyltransferase with HDIG domain
MNITDLETIIARTGDLPAMPSIAVKVMELVGDPGASATDLQSIISTDQALTSKVLKIANSAMFGVSRDISTLSHAIMILGFSTIRSIVLATSTKSIYMRNPSKGKFSTKLLWDHSLGTALFARIIAEKTPGINAEEAFIAGLLHDIGKTVISLNFSDQYEEVISEVYNEGARFQEVEEAKMGFDHTQVGSLVLRKWNLTESLEKCVLYHHSPGKSENYKELSAVVSLANEFSNVLGFGPDSLRTIDIKESEAWKILNFSEAQLEEMQTILEESIENNSELFSL